MIMTPLNKAHFVHAAHKLKDLPENSLPEIAFAGRSNAGKSSALNQIVNQKKLAYTSKTPGRTQQINFFEVDPYGYLVDLPGYGYADVPLTVRQHWDRVLGAYINDRQSLAGLVLIMDVRHPLKPVDWQLLDEWLPSGRQIHVLLTKSDKLSKREADKALADTRNELSKLPVPVTVQLFSSLNKQGVEEARKVIEGWLGIPEADKK